MFKKIFLVLVLLFITTSLTYAVDVKIDWATNPSATGYFISMSTDGGVTWLSPIDIKLVKPYTYLNVPEDKLVLFKIAGYKSITAPVWTNYAGAWYDHRLRLTNTVGAGIAE